MLLLLFQGTPLPLPTVSQVWEPGAMSLRWRDTSHNRYPIDKFTSLDVSQGKFLTGTLEVTASYNADWVQAYLANDDPIGQAIELWYRDTTDPLFIGAPVKVRRFMDNRHPDGGVTITCEHLFGHLFRRAIAVSTNNGGFKTFAGITIEADILAQRMMNDVLGIAYASGGVSATAPVYNLTVDRGEAGQFAPWTLDVPAIHSPALSAHSELWDYQDGRNYLDTLLDLAERGNIALTMDETSTPGTFEVDSTGTYQRSDLTASVILSELRGTVFGYDHEIDYTGTSNTWHLKFDGSGTTQSGLAWYQDATVSTIGIFENTATVPYVTSATAQGNLKDALMNLYAAANTSIDVTLVPRAGALFNSDFKVRDLVRWESGIFGMGADALVVGYDISVDASGRIQESVTLNSQPRSLTAMLRQAVPLEGGRTGGGLLHQRDG